jgi:hypothetical protein
MYLPICNARIGRSGRALQCKQNTPSRPDQREKPIQSDIVAKKTARVAMPYFADEQLQEFRAGAALR